MMFSAKFKLLSASVFFLIFQISLSQANGFRAAYSVMEIIDTFNGNHDAFEKLAALFKKSPPKYIHELADYDAFKNVAKDYCRAVVISEAKNGEFKLDNKQMEMLSLKHLTDRTFEAEIEYNVERMYLLSSKKKGSCKLIVDEYGKITHYSFIHNI